MPTRLQELLERARNSVPTKEDEEEQRRSFAYGNTKIGNPRITREIIDLAADALNGAKSKSSPHPPSVPE